MSDVEDGASRPGIKTSEAETESPLSILILPPTFNPLVIDALFATLKLSVTFTELTSSIPIFATGASIPPKSIMLIELPAQFAVYAYFPETYTDRTP